MTQDYNHCGYNLKNYNIEHANYTLWCCQFSSGSTGEWDDSVSSFWQAFAWSWTSSSTTAKNKHTWQSTLESELHSPIARCGFYTKLDISDVQPTVSRIRGNGRWLRKNKFNENSPWWRRDVGNAVSKLPLDSSDVVRNTKIEYVKLQVMFLRLHDDSVNGRTRA